MRIFYNYHGTITPVMADAVSAGYSINPYAIDYYGPSFGNWGDTMWPSDRYTTTTAPSDPIELPAASIVAPAFAKATADRRSPAPYGAGRRRPPNEPCNALREDPLCGNFRPKQDGAPGRLLTATDSENRPISDGRGSIAIEEKTGFITITMPEGLKIGKIENGKLAEPSAGGLELIFAEYIKKILDGRIDDFNESLFKFNEKRRFVIRQRHSAEIALTLQQLIYAYGKARSATHGKKRSEKKIMELIVQAAASIFYPPPPGLRAFSKGLSPKAMKGLHEIYNLFGKKASTLASELSFIEHDGVNIITPFLEAFERLSEVARSRDITGLSERINFTFSQPDLDVKFAYGLAHEIIRIDGLIRSGANITAIGSNIPDIRGKKIAYHGWILDKGTGILHPSTFSLTDPIEADAYIAPRTVVEIKSMRSRHFKDVCSLLKKMASQEPIRVGRYMSSARAIDYAIQFLNQILKLGMAVQNGTIDRVEFHITTDMLDPVSIDAIQNNIPNVTIYKYDKLDTEVKDRMAVPCSQEFHWEPQVPGRPGRFRKVSGPPSGNGQLHIIDKSPGNISAFLPEISADDETITMRMQNGLTIGTIREGALIEPSPEGLELAFTAYIRHFLEGNISRFDLDVLRQDKRKIRIVQNGGEEITAGLENLTNIYGSHMGPNGRQRADIIGRLQDAADSILRPLPDDLMVVHYNKLNIRERKFLFDLCGRFGVERVRRLLTALKSAERDFPGMTRFFFRMAGGRLTQSFETGEKWALELVESIITARPDFKKIHMATRILQLKEADIELTEIGSNLGGIRGKSVQFQGWYTETILKGVLVPKPMTMRIGGDAYSGPGRTMYLFKLLPRGLTEARESLLYEMFQCPKNNIIRFRLEDTRLVVAASQFFNEVAKLRAAVQEGIIDHVEYHITGELLEPVMVDIIQHMIPRVKIFLYKEFFTDYGAREEFPPNTGFHWVLSGAPSPRYKRIRGFNDGGKLPDSEELPEETAAAPAQMPAQANGTKSRRAEVKKAAVANRPQAPAFMDKFAALLHSSEAELVGLLVQAGRKHDSSSAEPEKAPQPDSPSYHALAAIRALHETPRTEMKIHDSEHDLDRRVCLVLQDWKLYVVEQELVASQIFEMDASTFNQRRLLENYALMPAAEWLRAMKEHWMPYHNIDPARKIFITITGPDKKLTAELDSSAGLLIK